MVRFNRSAFLPDRCFELLVKNSSATRLGSRRTGIEGCLLWGQGRDCFGLFRKDRIRIPKPPWLAWDREKTGTPACDRRQNFLYVRVAPPAIRWRSQECLLSLSWRGITYEPENGKLRIPAAAAPEAVSHAFVGIAEEV